MIMGRWFAAAVALGAALVWSPPAPTAQPAGAKRVVELQAGSPNPKGDMFSEALDRFAELVKAKTNGEVIVRVSYGALGAEQQLTEQVVGGSVDIGMISSGPAARFTSAYLVYDLPFLFKSYDNMLKSLETPAGRKLIRQFETDLGVKMLFSASFGGGRDVETRNTPLRVPADIKGLKIRTTSAPTDLAVFRAWGANPTPLDWGQVFAALQQGVVDGYQNQLSSVLAVKHYEVVKYAIRLDYQAAFESVFMNAKQFTALRPQHQKAFVEAGEETKVWQHQDAARRQASAVQELRKHGMAIHQPTPEEYAQWAGIREKVWQEVAEQLKGKIDVNVAKQLYEGQR
jgi:tripartite ATP-independent transporter DctP family solute receptor